MSSDTVPTELIVATNGDLVIFEQDGAWLIGIIGDGCRDYIIAMIDDFQKRIPRGVAYAAPRRQVTPAAGQLVGKSFATLRDAYEALKGFVKRDAGGGR